MKGYTSLMDVVTMTMYVLLLIIYVCEREYLTAGAWFCAGVQLSRVFWIYKFEGRKMKSKLNNNDDTKVFDRTNTPYLMRFNDHDSLFDGLVVLVTKHDATVFDGVILDVGVSKTNQVGDTFTEWGDRTGCWEVFNGSVTVENG